MMRLLAVLLLALTTCYVPAASAGDPVLLEQARAAYRKARAGQIPLADALAIVDDFLADHPGDPAATVYKGSIRTMMARDSFLPWRKLRYLNEGLELMDDAVARLDQAKGLDGRDARLEILLVSGNTNANVPKFFARRAHAERDFRAVLSSPDFDKLTAQERSAVYAWLAVFASDTAPVESERLLGLARQLDAETAAQTWDKR